MTLGIPQLQLTTCWTNQCCNTGSVTLQKDSRVSKFSIRSHDKQRLSHAYNLSHCWLASERKFKQDLGEGVHGIERSITTISSRFAFQKSCDFDGLHSRKFLFSKTRAQENYSTKRSGLGVDCRLDENLEVGSEIDYNRPRDGEFEQNKPKSCSFRRSRASQDVVETANESGYVIKVSKELMGVFQYVEKVKRARLKELSETLRQVATACFFFSFIKGVITPFVEVFKTHPPAWSRLIVTLGAFDAFAITYLAMKALEPLDRLSTLATECTTERDMMGSIEKEEELMLALAIDLVRLFRRLRNLAFCTAVTQFAHILHAMLHLQKSYPNFAINIVKFVKSWLSTPWV